MVNIINEQGPVNEHGPGLMQYRTISPAEGGSDILVPLAGSSEWPPLVVNFADYAMAETGMANESELYLYANDILEQVGSREMAPTLREIIIYDTEDGREEHLPENAQEVIDLIDFNAPDRIEYTNEYADHIGVNSMRISLSDMATITFHDGHLEEAIGNGNTVESTVQDSFEISIDLLFDADGHRRTDLQPYGNGLTIRDAVVSVTLDMAYPSENREGDFFETNGNLFTDQTTLVRVLVHDAHLNLLTGQLQIGRFDTIRDWDKDALEVIASIQREGDFEYDSWYLSEEEMAALAQDHVRRIDEMYMTPEGFDWKFWGLDEPVDSLETAEGRKNYESMGREAAGVALMNAGRGILPPHIEWLADSVHRVSRGAGWHKNFMSLAIEGFSADNTDPEHAVTPDMMLPYADAGKSANWYPSETREAHKLWTQAEKSGDYDAVTAYSEKGIRVFGQILAATLTEESDRAIVLARLEQLRQLDIEEEARRHEQA